MFINKQDTLDITVKPDVAVHSGRLSRWSSLAFGALLIGALTGPVCAQQDNTDGTQRTGDKPDTVIKKDSAAPGTKPKTDKKSNNKNDKSTAKSNAKSSTKMSGKDNKKTANKSGYESKRVVLVFPVDATGAAAQQLSDVITDVEKSRLASAGGFGPISFLPSLPSIRRSVTEQSLTPADIAPPFATTYKAQKLTGAAGYDAAIISSLDSYDYNADDQNVTMVLSIQMIDYSGSAPKSYTAADTVKTAPKSAKNATDIAAASDAARNLTEKLMTRVLASAMAAKNTPAGTTSTTNTATPPVK